MKLLKKIESSKGGLFLADANQLGIQRVDFDSKLAFQISVLKVMLSNVLGEVELAHYKNGAPYLVDGSREISISHSGNLFVIYLSDKESVGVDVELKKKDLNKGKSYFLNEEEQELHWSNDELYVIWSAKEAFYKSCKGQISNLAKEVKVTNITSSEVWICFKSKMKILSYLSQDGWILVYT